MNLSGFVADNLSEVLLKVVEFTQKRQKILLYNINNAYSADFIPRDLDVAGFSDCINTAIDAHLYSGRLVFGDTGTVKFGRDGTVEVRPIIDISSNKIHQQNPAGYVRLQIRRLLANSLDQKNAAELLRRRRPTTAAPR